MKIHEVEKIVGITKRNIRFYEKQGLLLPGRDNLNGYREYGADDIAALKFIKLFRKLAVPIDEILKMQKGELTAEDALRRHLIKLERESKNLEQTKLLCAQMAKNCTQAQTVDPDHYLAQITGMEKEGTRFQDIKKDEKAKSTAAVSAALCMIVVMSLVFVWLLVAVLTEAVPVLPAVLLLLCPAAVIFGVFLALRQRIKEIKGGEENAAAQY